MTGRWIILLVAVVIVLIPTVGMYRETVQHDADNTVAWTVITFVLAVLIPIIGPLILWLLYTFVVVRSAE